MKHRVLAAVAVGALSTALVLTGCGSSDSTASTAAETTATVDTMATATTATTATTSGKVLKVACVGAEEACSVKIGIGGGRSNQAVQVELTGTNMGEPTVTASDAADKGAYEISDATFTTGGSIYAFTLNAVESLPDGAYITLDFAQKK